MTSHTSESVSVFIVFQDPPAVLGEDVQPVVVFRQFISLPILKKKHS